MTSSPGIDDTLRARQTQWIGPTRITGTATAYSFEVWAGFGVA